MPQPTLAGIFPGATQTITEIVIPKSALAGLTAVAANGGDNIMAGITAAAMAYYTEVRRTGNPAAVPPVVGDYDVSIVVEEGRRSISTNFDPTPPMEYQDHEIIFRYSKLLPSSSFDPDDF